MKIDRNHAIKFWDEKYPYQEVATDFAGRLMNRENYGKIGVEGCWTIDHIMPDSNLCSSNAKENLTCTHTFTNNEKGSSTGTFKANGRIFNIRKGKGNSKAYFITEVYDESKDIISYKK